MSFCVAALLALGACGGGGADDSAGDGPQTPVSSSEESQTPTTGETPETSETPETPDASSEESESPEQSPSSSPTQAPRLIAYAGGESAGVEVHDRADTKKLRGAPADFKRFIGDVAERLADEAPCTDASVGVTVQTLRTDGFAAGGVNDCGGYAALWAVVDGHWKEIQGTQDSWSCRGLRRYHVPSDVAGDRCYDYTAQQGHHYHQA